MIDANTLTIHKGKFNDVGGDYHDPRTWNTTEYLKNSPTPSPVEETQNSAEHIVPLALESSVGNPAALTNPQPDIAHQDPHVAAAAVEPYVEPATVDALEPVSVVQESTHQHKQATLTETLVEERTSHFDELIAESIKDFESTDHIDNDSSTALSEAVHDNADSVSSEPDYGHGEVAEYYHDDGIPTASKVVHENVNAALSELDFGKLEVEADNHNQAVAVTTECERQETTEPISMPVPVPNYEVSSYPINLGSGQELWGGEDNYGGEGLHFPFENAYPSSVPAIIPSSEDLKRVERSPAPSVRFVDFFSLSMV